MKIIAFGASNSRKSINKILAAYAAGLLNNASPEVLDLNDYELPLFSEDREHEMGKPELAINFLTKIENCDALIISFAEHNGSYSVAYKNLFDWCSRIKPKVYLDKPMILMSASPGPGGGASVLAAAIHSMSYFGGIVKGSFSLPKFHENFDPKKNLMTNKELLLKLKTTVEGLIN